MDPWEIEYVSSDKYVSSDDSVSDKSAEERNVEKNTTTSVEPSIAAAASAGKEKKEKKKKKEEEVHDWFSYHGRMQLKLYNPVSVMLLRRVSPYIMMYNVDGFNAPPMSVKSDLGLLAKCSDLVILGSWNGLVAVYQPSLSYASLINPNTSQPGQILRLKMPRPLWNPNLFGLCYDSGQYKGIICDIESLHGPEIVVVRFREMRGVHTQQFRFPKLKSLSRNIGTVVNGVPYWVCENHMECSILKFDSKTEKLKMVPQLPSQLQVSQLGTLDGRLTATIYNNDEMEIWTLTEFSNGRCVSWARMFVLPENYYYISTLSWLIRDLELLLITGNGKLFVYNVRQKKQRLLSLDLQHMTGNMAIAYTPSFRMIPPGLFVDEV